MRAMKDNFCLVASLLILLGAVACGEETPEPVVTAEPTVGSTPSATGASATPKPESTEGRPWGQPLKKPAGAPVLLG